MSGTYAGLLVLAFLGAIAGWLASRAQIQLRKVNKLLYDAARVKAAADAEFERWLKARDALNRELAEIAAGRAPRKFDHFNRPPGCLCREVDGGALKIEDYCPAHNPPPRVLS